MAIGASLAAEASADPIVVTGCGALIPGLEGWDSVVGHVTRATGVSSDLLAEQEPLAWDGRLRPLSTPLMVLAMSAVNEAIEASGRSRPLGARAVVLAAGPTYPDCTVDALLSSFRDGGRRVVSPRAAMMAFNNRLAAGVAQQVGVSGHAVNLDSACATGAHILLEAITWLSARQAECVVVVGSDGELPPAAIASLGNMGVHSRSGRASPFSGQGAGFVARFGAVAAVVERMSTAERRGVQPVCVLLGGAVGFDPTSGAGRDESGEVLTAVIREGLRSAGLPAEEIVHVTAHGSGTRPGDTSEASALETVFGREAVPVSALKGSIGHLGVSAGLVEALLSGGIARTGVALPTGGTDRVDPSLGIDLVRGATRRTSPGPTLALSAGIGGHLAATILGP